MISELGGPFMLADIVITDRQVLPMLEVSCEYDGLAIKPAENNSFGFITVVDAEPHPLGFARFFILYFEFNEITGLKFQRWVSDDGF